MKKAAAALLLLLLAVPVNAWTYTHWPLVWEGVVGVEQLDDCTERVWYERVFSDCVNGSTAPCAVIYELSVYNVDHCSGYDGPDVQQPEAQN